MTIDDLDTPVLLIDVNVLDRNLRKMARYCNEHHLALRPHTKTHKMIEIARLQLRHGATGITVARPGEAEVMAGAGMDDILIVYPLWGERKVETFGQSCKPRESHGGSRFACSGQRHFASGEGGRQ